MTDQSVNFLSGSLLIDEYETSSYTAYNTYEDKIRDTRHHKTRATKKPPKSLRQKKRQRQNVKAGRN